MLSRYHGPTGTGRAVTSCESEKRGSDRVRRSGTQGRDDGIRGRIFAAVWTSIVEPGAHRFGACGSFVCRFGRTGEMRRLSAEWTKKLNVKAINDNAQAVELSGGNQQKLVIGKGLIQAPRLVIFDEPTRGVDVGAIAEIHQLINRLADDGLAVVVISSYLPEIMNLSDRILVCRQGRVMEEISPLEATEETIMYAAVH